METNKKPFYKKWWFICIAVIVVIGMVGSIKNGIQNASDKKAAYTWPNSTLASMIPQPDSKYGKVTLETEEYFSIDIYKIPKKSFEEYVEACKNSGFTEDYTKQDTYYSANNEDKYSLILYYDEKEKTLSISLCAPDEDSSIPENENASLTEEKESENMSSTEQQEGENSSPVEQQESGNADGSAGLNGGGETPETSDAASENAAENETNPSSSAASGDIRPEFKELLDGYESFMNEYCDFMKKYAESDNALSMAMDYTRILQKEVEWLEKIDNLESEEMNAAEAKYYAEVTLRVSQKLIEAAQ